MKHQYNQKGYLKKDTYPLREKCPYSEFFWSAISRIRTELSALCRISNYIDSDKCKLLVNAFVKSQFSYCPLTWMFCTRESNYRLNRVHERALRIISKDYISSFNDLVTLLNEKTIHQRCMNFLMTEIFK